MARFGFEDLDLAKAAAHAASGGVQSAIFGGNFGDGAISGLVGSLTGSAGTSLGISNSLVGSYLIGGTASAITSQITGGDPFQAFITGGTVAAFNHYLHKLDSPVDRRGGYVVGFTPKGEMIARSMTKEGNVFEYTTRAQKRTQLSVKKSLRTPDYTQVSLGIPIGLSPLSFSPSYTVDRYGQNYLSPGVGLGFGTGVSVSVTANWLEQTSTPYPDEMYNFLSGASVSGTAGFGFGVQGTQSSTGQNASGFGFMTPQFGGSYSYTPSWLIWNKQ